MKLKLIFLAILISCSAMAQMNFRALQRLQTVAVNSSVHVPYITMSFGIADQAAPVAPSITAPSLLDNFVVWTDPDGTTIEGRTPPASFLQATRDSTR